VAPGGAGYGVRQAKDASAGLASVNFATPVLVVTDIHMPGTSERDWQTATRKLLEQAMGSQIQRELRERNEQVRWDLVMQLARGPLGVPVAITDPSASLGPALADARQVQNRLPDGAAWDGRTELPMDEETFERVLSKLGATA
jgi:CheY-like chemotaxis protein